MLYEHLPFFVPPSSIQKQSINVNTVLRWCVRLIDRKNLYDHEIKTTNVSVWLELREDLWVRHKIIMFVRVIEPQNQKLAGQWGHGISWRSSA